MMPRLAPPQRNKELLRILLCDQRRSLEEPPQRSFHAASTRVGARDALPCQEVGPHGGDDHLNEPALEFVDVTWEEDCAVCWRPAHHLQWVLHVSLLHEDLETGSANTFRRKHCRQWLVEQGAIQSRRLVADLLGSPEKGLGALERVCVDKFLRLSEPSHLHVIGHLVGPLGGFGVGPRAIRRGHATEQPGTERQR